MYCVFLVPVGCILGNPYGKPDEKVLIPGRTQLEIKNIEGTSKSPRKLALKLLGLLFTKDEMKEVCAPLAKVGNCLIKSSSRE